MWELNLGPFFFCWLLLVFPRLELLKLPSGFPVEEEEPPFDIASTGVSLLSSCCRDSGIDVEEHATVTKLSSVACLFLISSWWLLLVGALVAAADRFRFPRRLTEVGEEEEEPSPPQ